MKKVFLIITVTLISVFGLKAQDYKKEWADGKLIWEDFTEKKIGQRFSELKYSLAYNTEKQKYDGTVVERIVAKGYIDKRLSWIDPEYKTEQYLRYNQIIFDIVEIHRRKLQVELDRVGSSWGAEGSFRFVYDLCVNEIDRFNRESNSGHNLSAITFWEEKISDALTEYSAKSIPEFEKRSFGYALHAGFGAGSFTGSLGEHFSPTFNFMFGFDFAYKKSILYLNGTLAGAKVRKDYISDKNWYEKQIANVAIIDISYGYAFLDNKKLKLTPFVGLGITELSGKNKDNIEDGLRFVDYNVIFGLNADYKLRTKINLIPDPYMGIKEKVETSIRTRLYVTKADYTPDLKGYSINFTIGLCGFGNMIRVK